MFTIEIFMTFTCLDISTFSCLAITANHENLYLHLKPSVSLAFMVKWHDGSCCGFHADVILHLLCLSTNHTTVFMLF